MSSTIIDAFMNPIWKFIKDDINQQDLIDVLKKNTEYDTSLYSYSTSFRKKDHDKNHNINGESHDLCAWCSKMSLIDSIKNIILFVDNINETDDTKMCIIRFSSLILSYLIPFFNSAKKETKETYKKIGYLYNLFGQFPDNNEKSTEKALYYIDTTTIVRSLFIYIKTYWNDYTKNYVNRACNQYNVRRIKKQIVKKSFIKNEPISFKTVSKTNDDIPDFEKEIITHSVKEIKVIDSDFPELNENVVIKIKKNSNVFDNSPSSYSSIVKIKPDIPEEEEEEVEEKDPHEDWKKLSK